MMKVYIQRTVDYTLKRKGENIYTIVDENKKPIKMCASWKTKKSALDWIKELGYSYEGLLPTIHQNYGHWADFQFAK